MNYYHSQTVFEPREGAPIPEILDGEKKAKTAIKLYKKKRA